MTLQTSASSPAPEPAVPSDAHIELDEAQRFLDLLEPGGQFTFQTFTDNSSNKPKDRDPLAKVFHGILEDHAGSLAEINNQGGGVFVMVNKGDGQIKAGKWSCRSDSNVVSVRALFVDLDGAPLEPVLAAEPHPSIVVCSSPGHWHAYWRVHDCALAEFRPLQAQLIKKFNGDPAIKDLSRVLRVPGFVHQKGAPFTSQLLFPPRSSQ